jgi:hypothetical protein
VSGSTLPLRAASRCLAATLTRLHRTEQGVFGFGSKDVQTESLGDLLAHSDAADAVTVRVEPRREDTDAHFAGYDHQYTAAHAALGGDAYVERPLTAAGKSEGRPDTLDSGLHLTSIYITHGAKARNGVHVRVENLAWVREICKAAQSLETPRISLVAGAGVSGSSPLVGSLFCADLHGKPTGAPRFRHGIGAAVLHPI